MIAINFVVLGGSKRTPIDKNNVITTKIKLPNPNKNLLSPL